MALLPPFLELPARAVVAVAWLACAGWFGIMAAGYGLAAYGKSAAVGDGLAGPWVRASGKVEAVQREHGSEWGLKKLRERIAYTYVVDGRPYEGSSESTRWSSAAVSGESSAFGTLAAGMPLDVWVSTARPERSMLVEPAERGSAWPDLGRALASGAALVMVTLLAKAYVFRPLPSVREMTDVGPIRDIRETIEGVREQANRLERVVASEIPEPEDVSLPASIRIEPMPSGIRLEFPRQERDSRQVFGWLVTGAFGVIATWLGVTAKAGENGWIAIVFGLACAFSFVIEFRLAYRRCVVEVNPGGLVSRKGYGGLATRAFVARRDIDFLETSLSGATGQPGAFASHFRIAVIRADGKRIVLGDYVQGIAVADTLVRRIGRELGLHPEQVLNTAATMRRTVAPFGGIFPRKDRAG